MAPPNILLMIADDLPRNLLGAYGASHGLVPELDATHEFKCAYGDISNDESKDVTRCELAAL